MTSKKYKDPEWLEQKYWGEGLNTGEIGELCGVNRRTIARSLDEFSIKRRSNSQVVQNNHASFKTNGEGHEIWRTSSRETDGQVEVRIHRLLAVAEFGPGAVAGKHVHHKNEIPWDNRLANLELMEHGEHIAHHHRAFGWEDVLTIREMARNTDQTRTDLAELFGADRGAIRNVLDENGPYATGQLEQRFGDE